MKVRKHHWPPGTSGNPAGRSVLPATLVGIKELTKEEVRLTVSGYLRTSDIGLEMLIESKPLNFSSLDALICSIIIKAIKLGDYSRLDYLLSLCGIKPKLETSLEIMAISAEQHQKYQIVKSMSDDEIVKLLAKSRGA